MRNQNILLILLLFMSFALSAQMVLTKDGVPIMEMTDLMQECVGNEEILELQNRMGITFEVDSFCACIITSMFSNVHSSVFESVVHLEDREEMIMEILIQQPEAMKSLLECVEANVEYGEEFEFLSGESTELTLTIAKFACVEEIVGDGDMSEISREAAENYCECALTKLLDRGYKLSEVQTLTEEDSELFVEIVMPCVMEHLIESDEVVSNNVYDPLDIIGDDDAFIEVPLKEDLNNTYKIKVRIADNVHYFLFDTGASDMVIHRGLESKLRKAGVINDSMFVGTCTYTMANNELVEADTYLIDGIEVGGYTINNVYIDVFDNATLIMGMGFLNKFADWHFKPKEQLLLLWR
ncbi:MAG: retroviral-like aspartic protease family protein [Cryomorphaceae bacterium]|nr:retroviral-like aspartic protease family protein [Cryomorphaceae bacterium]